MTETDDLKKVREQFGPIQNSNIIQQKKLSKLDKLALFITEKVGTMGFFFIILGWTFLWLTWNVVAPVHFRFDPYPAFVLWLFISNLIQIHLMPLIMIGQNIQGKHQEIRSQHDYDTDKRAEAEVQIIVTKLTEQEKILKEILTMLDKIEKKP